MYIAIVRIYTQRLIVISPYRDLVKTTITCHFLKIAYIHVLKTAASTCQIPDAGYIHVQARFSVRVFRRKSASFTYNHEPPVREFIGKSAGFTYDQTNQYVAFP